MYFDIYIIFIFDDTWMFRYLSQNCNS